MTVTVDFQHVAFIAGVVWAFVAGLLAIYGLIRLLRFLSPLLWCAKLPIALVVFSLLGIHGLVFGTHPECYNTSPGSLAGVIGSSVMGLLGVTVILAWYADHGYPKAK